jgi:hypothetical protein
MKTTKQTRKSVFFLAVLLATLAPSRGVFAQTAANTAKVSAIKGGALSVAPGSSPVPLHLGDVLPEGSLIKTGVGSAVDLSLGKTGGGVRLTANSFLALTKLALQETNTAREIQLDLREGTMLGNVGNWPRGDQYQIKISNGILGIGGGQFRVDTRGYIVQLTGTSVFAYVPASGEPVAYTLTAPPPVYFSPLEGVKVAPKALVGEVQGQAAARLH